MLDTIVIHIPAEKFELQNPTFSSKKFNKSGNYLVVSTEDVIPHEYFPQITLCQKWGNYLKIEFSVTKLLFQNNFDEASENDFQNLIHELLRKLAAVGVFTNQEYLKEAEVMRLDFSKNIVLEPNSTCNQLLDVLSKVDLNKKFDLSTTKYTSGESLCVHSKSYQVIWYDKLKEMQNKKMASSLGNSKQNLFVFDRQSYPKNFEVLRFEARYTKRRKIKDIAKKVDFQLPLTLENIFKDSFPQKVLWHLWNKIVDDLRLPMKSGKNVVETYYELTSNHPNKKPSKLLFYLGSLVLIDELGMKRFRSLVTEKVCDKTWFRLKNEMKAVKLSYSNEYSVVSYVENCLKEFEPVKLKHYEYYSNY